LVIAHYRAACQARSRREFISKISTCLEEADESTYWLEVIEEARLLPHERLSPLVAESKELSAIFGASRRTASANEAADCTRQSKQPRQRTPRHLN
jgi:four helix bundle protein